MTDCCPSGREGAEQSAADLARTFELLDEAEQETVKFQGYLHDNHWADKARLLWAARYA